MQESLQANEEYAWPIMAPDRAASHLTCSADWTLKQSSTIGHHVRNHEAGLRAVSVGAVETVVVSVKEEISSPLSLASSEVSEGLEPQHFLHSESDLGQHLAALARAGTCHNEDDSSG